jgi:hypothetical protein
MTFADFASTHRLRGAVLAALAVAAVAIGVLGLADSARPTVSAQPIEDSCLELRYTICVSKETIGGDGLFRFDYWIDEEDDLPENCLLPFVQEELDTYYLSDGDSFPIRFECSLRLVESPQPGWQLVDIDCDYNNEIWDIRPISNGILILYNPASEDNAEPDIECTFINRRIEERPLNLGGLFAGQPTPLPTAPPVAAPAATSPAITPPRTGDAGLK